MTHPAGEIGGSRKAARRGQDPSLHYYPKKSFLGQSPGAAFALRAGGRSPRVAKQFVELLAAGVNA